MPSSDQGCLSFQKQDDENVVDEDGSSSATVLPLGDVPLSLANGVGGGGGGGNNDGKQTEVAAGGGKTAAAMDSLMPTENGKYDRSAVNRFACYSWRINGINSGKIALKIKKLTQ